MINITNSERNMISILVQFAIITGAVLSGLAYVNSRKYQKLNQEVAMLDKEIKLLQLQEKKASIL